MHINTKPLRINTTLLPPHSPHQRVTTPTPKHLQTRKRSPLSPSLVSPHFDSRANVAGSPMPLPRSKRPAAAAAAVATAATATPAIPAPAATAAPTLSRSTSLVTDPALLACKCPFAGCGLRFDSPSEVQAHLRTHTGDKMFECPWESCKRRFSRLSNLRTHIRTHTKEKPYPCQHPGCGKRFARSDALKVHQRSHTGVKAYACINDGCNKRFAGRDSLKNHHKTCVYRTADSPENPFPPTNRGKSRSSTASSDMSSAVENLPMVVGTSVSLPPPLTSLQTRRAPKRAEPEAASDSDEHDDDGDVDMAPTMAAPKPAFWSQNSGSSIGSMAGAIESQATELRVRLDLLLEAGMVPLSTVSPHGRPSKRVAIAAPSIADVIAVSGLVSLRSQRA